MCPALREIEHKKSQMITAGSHFIERSKFVNVKIGRKLQCIIVKALLNICRPINLILDIIYKYISYMYIYIYPTQQIPIFIMINCC